MGTEFEAALDPFIRGGVESTDGAIAVTYINAFRLWIIAKLIGVIGKLHGIQKLIGVRVENLACSVAFIRNDNAIQVRKIERHLRLYKFRLQAVDSPPSGHVKDLNRIIAV